MSLSQIKGNPHDQSVERKTLRANRMILSAGKRGLLLYHFIWLVERLAGVFSTNIRVKKVKPMQTKTNFDTRLVISPRGSHFASFRYTDIFLLPPLPPFLPCCLKSMTFSISLIYFRKLMLMRGMLNIGLKRFSKDVHYYVFTFLVDKCEAM